MTRQFKARIIREGIIDTRRYRYSIDWTTGEIKRIELDKLDTTAALTDWQIVATVNKQVVPATI